MATRRNGEREGKLNARPYACAKGKDAEKGVARREPGGSVAVVTQAVRATADTICIRWRRRAGGGAAKRGRDDGGRDDGVMARER